MARRGLNAASVTLAAAELADEDGVEALTVTALAARLGVRPPSLYAHVGGTDDLRRRVALLALEELADRAADALAGRSRRDAVVALGHVYRDYAREHPGRWAAARTPLDAATAAASAGPRLAELQRAVLRGYDLTGDDQTHAVRLLGSVFQGFTTLEAAGGFAHSAPDAATSWTHILDSLDRLLRGWAEDPGRTSR
ncbi:TetR/AcrR family transcriptional regulator [Nocardioides taihuensis]|uniref:TetR/AcrR family transcriptional regulator n=1 Tax=Nocardioides taihuensis TaxID=1835606 RepID=A0ABW0BLN8_9ACTN